MRILFVEDHRLFAEQIQPLLWKITGVTHVELVKSERSAIRALSEGFFDLIILDLRLPEADDDLSADKENGQRVFHYAIDNCPGLQIFILTGTEMDEFTKRLARHGDRVDLWGNGNAVNTLDYFEKENADKLLEEVLAVSSELAILNSIRLNTRGRRLDLSPGFERILRIAARRLGGTAIDITPLSGGLSKARVLRCTVSSEQGQMIAYMVVKLGPRSHVDLESKAYNKHVKLLPIGFFPPTLDAIDKGACGSSGIFYSVAQSFNRLLFDIIDAPSNGAAVVRDLRRKMDIWITAFQIKEATIREIRQFLVPDDLAEDLARRYGLNISSFENKVISYRHSCVHGDLHGGNVLVDGQLVPILIDFGDVGHGPSCLDPITLELSCIFHPDGARILKHSVDELNFASWLERDIYEVDHPYKEFVRACREWAYDVAGGDVAFAAISYAYLLRQLKFTTVDSSVTLPLLRKTIDNLKNQI